MGSVALAIAVLSGLLSLALLLAVAQLARTVGGLRAELIEVLSAGTHPGTAERDSIPRLANDEGSTTVLLAVTSGCSSCTDRIRDLQKLSLPPGTRTMVVTPSPFAGTTTGEVDVVVDPDFFGALRVQATPSVHVVDDAGRELKRAVVGSRSALEQAVAILNEKYQQHPSSETQGAMK